MGEEGRLCAMFPKGVPLFSGSKDAQYKLPVYGKKTEMFYN